MDTIVIKINEKDKIASLVAFLKSIDYIQSVEYLEKYTQMKRLLDETNAIAAETELSRMTLDEVNEDVKAYRREKQSNGH